LWDRIDAAHLNSRIWPQAGLEIPIGRGFFAARGAVFVDVVNGQA
jgi:hypothetical protein